MRSIDALRGGLQDRCQRRVVSIGPSAQNWSAANRKGLRLHRRRAFRCLWRSPAQRAAAAAVRHGIFQYFVPACMLLRIDHPRKRSGRGSMANDWEVAHSAMQLGESNRVPTGGARVPTALACRESWHSLSVCGRAASCRKCRESITMARNRTACERCNRCDRCVQQQHLRPKASPCKPAYASTGSPARATKGTFDPRFVGVPFGGDAGAQSRVYRAYAASSATDFLRHSTRCAEFAGRGRMIYDLFRTLEGA
jgi:hypothetical protein